MQIIYVFTSKSTSNHKQVNTFTYLIGVTDGTAWLCIAGIHRILLWSLANRNRGHNCIMLQLIINVNKIIYHIFT